MTDKMNTIPKYVVSNTLKRADWNNTTILSGDVAAQVASSRPSRAAISWSTAARTWSTSSCATTWSTNTACSSTPSSSAAASACSVIGSTSTTCAWSRRARSNRVSSCVTYAPDSKVPTSPYIEQYRWTHEQIRSLQAAEDIDRTLATVFFADIVDSTGRAVAMGDRAWRKLLEQHQRDVHAVVERWRGKDVEFSGDGVIAIFDAPTRALRCAFELVAAARGLDIEIRAGIHTGEIERGETGVGGIGVHIAARVLGAAEPGQVVVTKTVRDLATGTDLTFRPLGVTELRGVPGEWELFEARTSDR